MLGASIGGGEFLLGPTVFVRHGLTLLWVTSVAVFFQTVFNTELMRYTLATGEPVFTGFMRTRPHAVVWAWFYAILFFLQVGWPASAGRRVGRDLLSVHRARSRMPARSTRSIDRRRHVPAVRRAAAAVGRRIERTLELLNWIMVVCMLGGAVLALLLVPGGTWWPPRGTRRVRYRRGGFDFLPATPTSSCWPASSRIPGAAG